MMVGVVYLTRANARTDQKGDCMQLQTQSGYLQVEPIKVSRITGLSLAMAFYGAAMLLISIPSARNLVVTAPKMLVEPLVNIEIEEKPIVAIKNEITPPINKPIEVIRPPEVPVVTIDPPTISNPTTPSFPDPVNIEPATPAIGGGEDVGVSSGPLEVGELATIDHPMRYPRGAIPKGLEGEVILRVLVGADGAPISATVERSSGHRILDEHALKQVLATWRFRVPMRDGKPIEVIGFAPIQFRIIDG